MIIPMRSHRVFFAPAVLVGCFLFALSMGSAPAAAAKKPAPPPDMRKLIKSVDKDTSSVVIIYQNSKLTHTYHIDDVTQLTVNGVPGKLADIKPGMVVTDYVERDNDDLDGLKLTGYGTEPAAKKPTTKPAAKPVAKPTPAPSTN
jgi:hypothetical protein